MPHHLTEPGRALQCILNGSYEGIPRNYTVDQNSVALAPGDSEAATNRKWYEIWMDLYQHDSAMEAQALLPQQCHLQFHFAIHQGDVQQASTCNSLGKNSSIRFTLSQHQGLISTSSCDSPSPLVKFFRRPGSVPLGRHVSVSSFSKALLRREQQTWVWCGAG